HTRFSRDWSSDVCSSDLFTARAAGLLLQWAGMLTTPPLSLYVHLPWCVRKCPYCDFNSHEYRGEGGRGALPFDAYVDALVADLRSEERRVGKEGRRRWSV